MLTAAHLQPAMGFSVGEEREVGEKLLYAVRASFPILDDPDLHHYITNIGQEVLDVAGVQFFNYHFYIVESSQFNAFAAPSGLIFFYTKLIESMNSEDELVSVMAHEVGHVVRRHLASRMKKGKIINIASLGAALAAIALGGGGAAAQGLLAGSLAAGQSAQLHFSRQDEIEADLLAYEWMQDMQRDTVGQKRMLQTMRRITRYRTGQIPQYLLTHPDPEARLDYVESLIAADKGYRVESDEMRNFDFLRFKYRILSMTQKSSVARGHLASELSDPRATEFERTMALYGLSQIDQRTNNYEQSLARIDEVIAVFPDQSILLVDKAAILSDQGEYLQARLLLEQVRRKEPNNSYVLYNLGRVTARLGDSELAVELFKEVAYNNPEFSDVYFEIGKILSGQGKNIEARFYLGQFNLYEGKLKLAAANFKQVADKTEEQSELGKESREMLALIERLNKK
ncbi:MAG: M48 family metalloprotease [Desulfofustis sp.]|nr:M48 family metalloprotease [Desulfofustis sp.]